MEVLHYGALNTVTQLKYATDFIFVLYVGLPQIHVLWSRHDTYRWQSRVEIKDYSIMYFDCITVFKVPYR